MSQNPAGVPEDDLVAALLAVAPGATVITGHAWDIYAEVMNTDDMSVWMTDRPITTEEFDAMEVSALWIKTGTGAASMDIAAFRCSPGGELGSPMREIEFGGRRFVNVARPAGRTDSDRPGGPMRATVDKHHVLGFAKGREITLMETPEGLFVEVVGTGEGDYDLVLPEGARLRHVTLDAPWIVDLPAPTSAFFWIGEDLRSFQGPVALPENQHG